MLWRWFEEAPIVVHCVQERRPPPRIAPIVLWARDLRPQGSGTPGLQPANGHPPRGLSGRSDE